MRVTDLMNKFIKERINIACVVDEFGGIAGLITLEDILEEIFGEIEDEHDEEEHVEVQLSGDEFLLSGRLEIDYLNEKYEGLQFPEGEYQTLSGYLVMTQETIPRQGDEIILNGYKFILELVSDTKIETVRVIRLPEGEL
jgi:CBS domain containing-hemolysin-like protein